MTEEILKKKKYSILDQKKIKKRGDDEECFYCNETFSKSRDNERRIRCSKCKNIINFSN